MWHFFPLLLLPLFLVLSSCSREPATDDTALRIGVISVLSGEFAYIGDSWVKGIELAHKEYLQANPSRAVSLHIEDDGFQSARGIAAFRKITAANKIDALLNLSTPTISAIGPLLVNAPLPVIQWAEATESPRRDSVFQIQPSFVLTDQELGTHLKNLELENPLIVHSDALVNFRVAEAIWSHSQKEMTKYVIPSTETDLKTHLLRIMQSKPSHLVLALDPNQSALFLRELFTHYPPERPAIIHSSVFHVGIQSYKEILGHNIERLNDDLTIIVEKPSSEAFAKNFKEQFGEEPGIASDTGYDAFNILVETYHPDKSIWTERIRSYIGTGASGDISFNDVGLREPVTRIVRVAEILK